MKNHSMIVDDFFSGPIGVKSLIDAVPMADLAYDDGVTYPNIVYPLPAAIENQIDENLGSLFGPNYNRKLSFARYSFKDTNPPHWAHSDRNISQFLALIYLNAENEQPGTALMRHNDLGFETHPATEVEKEVLLRDANARDKWTITHTVFGKFNRCFILDAGYIHAAMDAFGEDRSNGRLVVSVFFDCNPP